jgi:outer membrane protein assembly factor BamE (lipoprotein component of BamABCDE complex)
MLVVQRQFICRVLIVLPFIVLLAGCMSTDTSGVKVDPAQLEQIKLGQTTQAEVESLLGKPTSSEKSHGQTEMCYGYHQYENREMGVGLVGLVPALLFCKMHVQSEGAIIIIGKDGKVADIKRTGHNSHITGLLVKDDYPKADLTKEDQIQPGVTTEEQVNTLLGAPPSIIGSSSWNSHFALWFYKTGQFNQLIVSFRQDGIVDEVKKSFKGGRWSPKRVNADKVAQIKEQQSTRQTAESIFGRPSTISRNVQGSFYTYYIQVGKTNGEVYIQYDSSGVITRLIRKSQPEQEQDGEL